jgi:hypothetical protein
MDATPRGGRGWRWAPAAIVLVVATAGVAVLSGFSFHDRSRSVTCVTPQRAYAAMIRSDGAIGYWRLNETTGSKARNAARPRPDGSYVGRPLLDQPGVFATAPAVRFDGRHRFVSIPPTARYRALRRWSVEAWVSPASPTSKKADIAFLTHAWSFSSLPFVLGYGSFNGVYSDARHAWTGFYSSTGFYQQALGVWSRIGSITGTWARVADPAVLPLDTWTHLVGTFDGTTIRLYKNGLLVNAATAEGKLPVAANVRLYIGSRWWLRSRQFFSGSVDEVALYPTALTRAQVEDHYTAVHDQGSARC